MPKGGNAETTTIRESAARESAARESAVAGDDWKAVRDALRARLGEDRYRRWFGFSHFERSSSDGLVVEVGVPNLFIRDWIERSYLEDLRVVCREHAGTEQVRLRVAGEPFRRFRDAEREFLAEQAPAGKGTQVAGFNVPPDVDPETLFPTAEPGSPRPGAGRPAPGSDERAGPDSAAVAPWRQLELPGARRRRPTALRHLDDRLTLDQLVVGKCNHVAYNAGLTALEQPGGAYNPLFIFGGSGLGKTHLLQGLTRAGYVGGERRVRYLSCEEFANRFIRAVRERSVEEFRAELAAARLLVIDDVQMLRNKKQTQQALLHTMDAVARAGAQMILASDTRPQELDGLHEQLRGRFVSGLVCRVGVPDYPTRVAILQREATRLGTGLPGDVLHVIAEVRHANVRELIGGLVQVHAESAIGATPVSEARVQEILERTAGVTPRGVTLDSIVATVARQHGMTAEELLSPSRARTVTAARQVAMHLARELTGRSLSEIGAHFGRNHSTVKFSLKRIAERRASDPMLSDRLDALIRELR